jgi:hypothetical protein
MSQPQLLQITGNLGAPVGIAVDEQKNRLFFVEYAAGTLKQISIPPVCGPGTSIPSCSNTLNTITSGLIHPEDVQIDLNQGCAYVTTRDDPGTTGKLWKINLSNGSKTLLAYNLGGPQQLFLDTSQNQAYSVSYNDGRLRLIDLTTGTKKPIITSLHGPVGLVVTNDRRYAYVAEQGPPAQISKIDLSTGERVSPYYVIRDGVAGISLVAPFFLAWTDDSQNSLYIAERAPANIVSRLDLITLQKSTVGANLPWPSGPSGVAINNSSFPKYLYVTTGSEIVRIDLNAWDLQNQPVFLGVGHVPWSRISSDGYADTHLDVGQPFQVTDAPFGGTLDVFGNLTNFINSGATHYEILMSKDLGQFLPINIAWNTYHWNITTLSYDLVPVAPESNTTRYKIPKETFDQNFHPELWYPPYLFLRWTSAENGFYRFKVKLYAGANPIIPDPLPTNLNILPLRIDNTPQNVKIESIWQKQKVPPDTQIIACDIVEVDPSNPKFTSENNFYFNITANDPNQHLLCWSLVALSGDNLTEPVDSDNYFPSHYSPPSRLWGGISNTNVPPPDPNLNYWKATHNCAYTFYLGSWKRTIDGYNYIFYRDYHKSITINNLPKIHIVTPIPIPLTPP